MWFIIAVIVVVSLIHVLVETLTKPLLDRDLRYLEERNDERYRAAKNAA